MTFFWIFMVPLMIVIGVAVVLVVYALLLTAVQGFDDEVRAWWHKDTKI